MVAVRSWVVVLVAAAAVGAAQAGVAGEGLFPQVKPGTSMPEPAAAPADPGGASGVVPAPSEPAVKKAVPPQAGPLNDAMKLVEDVYRDGLANAKTAPQQQLLARQMLATALDENDPAAQYACLSKAKMLATESGDAETVAGILNCLEEHFDTDLARIGADATMAVSKEVRTPEQRRVTAVLAQRYGERMLLQQNYSSARELSEVMTSAARAVGDTELSKQAGEFALSVKDCETAGAQVKKYEVMLAKKPADPALNVKVGRFRCFYCAQWKDGLANLAQGSDPALAALAKMEMKGAPSAQEQLKIGDGWWEAGSAGSGFVKKNVLTHASSFYTAALPQLSGLVKVRVENRLKEMETATSEASADQPSPILRLLDRLPRELLPAKDDSPDQLNAKNRQLEQWMASNFPNLNGTPLTLTAKVVLVNVSAHPSTFPPGAGQSASSGRAGQPAAEQRLSILLEQDFDYKGIKCQVHMSGSKPVAGPGDPLVAAARGWEKAGPEARFIVTFKVNLLAITESRPFTMNASRQRVATGEPPYISVYVHMALEDLTARPKQ